ncbi:unnamed protein product [Cylicocyclus nassatus]|uniref:C2 domain-containing protein n=1 Tax=Cylicocyclus nassatus TaxID=53992 RepID=A0AA36M444_CYLNA|nr:unnamed protein product [Cylicocyclus nassatus]
MNRTLLFDVPDLYQAIDSIITISELRFLDLSQSSRIQDFTVAFPTNEWLKDYSRPFVSHRAKGIPEDLILSCQVVGIDPTYGFPRICDQTASIRVFKDNASDCNRPQLATITTSHRKRTVHKHKERCPWCPDPSEVTVVQQTLPDDVPSADPTSVFMRLLGDDTIMPLSMLVLAGTAVISSLGIACVLIAFLRLKRSNRQFPSKSLSQPRSRSNLVKIPIRDAPWEQTRPTYWLSSSSKYEATTTSPLESVSSIGTRSSLDVPSYRSKVTIPREHLYHQIPPNSSVESEQEPGK